MMAMVVVDLYLHALTQALLRLRVMNHGALPLLIHAWRSYSGSGSDSRSHSDSMHHSMTPQAHAPWLLCVG